jgi:Tfp pilus assembly protein PilF
MCRKTFFVRKSGFLLLFVFGLNLPVPPTRAAQAPNMKKIEAEADLRAAQKKIAEGLQYFKEGKFPEAAYLLQTGIDGKAGTEEAMLALAFSYEEIGQSDKAIKYFRQTLKTTGRKDLAYGGLARSLTTQGRYKEAAEAAQSAIAGNPENPEFHVRLATARLFEKKLPQALESAETALRLKPDDEDALNVRVQIGYFLYAAKENGRDGKAKTSDPAKRRQFLNEKNAIVEDVLKRIESYLSGPDARNREKWEDIATSFRSFIEFENDRDNSPANAQRPKLLSDLKPTYTAAAREHEISGKVILTVFITAKGKAGFIIPVSGLPYGLTERAIQVVQKATFQPALRNGKLVPATARFEISFNFY